MKIALIGYGGMGQSAAKAAKERQHEIVSIVDPKHPEIKAKEINAQSLGAAEVAIDFASPLSALSNAKVILELGIPVVIGTTGWYHRMEELQELVQQTKGKAIWSSNFSVGVNLYFRLIESAARLFNDYPEYDIWATELHHNKKADSPSGTAKTLEKILLENIKRKTAIVEDKLDRAILPNEIHFSSTRGGAVNFSHTIAFDSAADSISVTHSARNRDGYALGAIQAAEWLVQQSPGLYSMEDFLGL